MKVRWTCPECKQKNEDARDSYVICVGCGLTYDKIPIRVRPGKAAK